MNLFQSTFDQLSKDFIRIEKFFRNESRSIAVALVIFGDRAEICGCFFRGLKGE